MEFAVTLIIIVLFCLSTDPVIAPNPFACLKFGHKLSSTSRNRLTQEKDGELEVPKLTKELDSLWQGIKKATMFKDYNANNALTILIRAVNEFESYKSSLKSHLDSGNIKPILGYLEKLTQQLSQRLREFSTEKDIWEEFRNLVNHTRQMIKITYERLPSQEIEESRKRLRNLMKDLPSTSSY